MLRVAAITAIFTKDMGIVHIAASDAVVLPEGQELGIIQVTDMILDVGGMSAVIFASRMLATILTTNGPPALRPGHTDQPRYQRC